MRALQLNGFGGVDVLEVRDVPLPLPRAGELRIRVVAAGLIHRVSDTFALDDAANAHRALESRGVRGRPVFTFD